ncbi:MAG: site-specific integrase [Clostridia bacterium]|nr:site-specific integrase [Clostridia bacterium]
MSKKRADGYIQRQVTLKNGKRKVFYGKTEKELNRKIAEFREDCAKGRYFRVIADEWETEHFPTIQPTTADSYRPALKRAIDEFGDMRCQSITPRQIQGVIERMAKKNYAMKTVQNQLMVLRMIFDYAALQGELEYNPCSPVKLPKGLSKTRREIPEDEQIERVKSGVALPFGLFAYFLLYTGCRRGEALALTYGDIDFQKRLIRVNKAVYFDGNTPKLKLPKTDAGTREIILLDVLAKHLSAKHNADDLVFPDESGKLMSAKHFRCQWKKYCAASGITITPHQLRHAYATILFEAGVEDQDAQELLGHANIAVTRDIYTHIRAKRKTETAKKLNAATM